MFTKNFLRYISNRTIDDLTNYFWGDLICWDGSTIQTVEGYTNKFCSALSLTDFMGSHIKRKKSDYQGEINWTPRGVCFGNGNTPATENDYCMAGELLVTYGYSQNVEKSKSRITYVYTITNNESEPFTICEVGLITYTQRVKTGFGAYQRAILLDRTVLESPITIPAGGVGQVTYTITMDGLE